MAPSKLPGRKGRPWPRSWRATSPSTSLSWATSNMEELMSVPTQIWPDSVRASPLKPEPQPRSRRRRGVPSLGNASNSRARSVSCCWILIMREFSVYLRASVWL